MPYSTSGRIVIEVDSDVKSELYRVLALDNSTMKKWFLRNARRYIDERAQPLLFDALSEIGRNQEVRDEQLRIGRKKGRKEIRNVGE